MGPKAIFININLISFLNTVAANTVSLRPASGRATLIPGQALHFQCQQLENKEAQFLW